MSSNRYIDIIPAITAISQSLKTLYDDMSKNEYTNQEYADAVAAIIHEKLAACGITNIGNDDNIIFGYYYSGKFYFDSAHEIQITPVTEILYFDLTSLQIYYYTTSYILITATLSLGETSTTAYRGDKGKTAYDHSLLTSGNPHNVTKTDVELGNVPNVSTNNQTPTYTIASVLEEITSGEILTTTFGKIKKAINSLISHINNTSNPHSVTYSQTGADASGAALAVQTNLNSHTGNTSNPHSVTKEQVGLGNCDNTADSNKSVSSATTLTGLTASVTELNYSKGVTSNIQPQLDDKISSEFPDIAVRYSFDEMPDLPDDSGAIYKVPDKSFTSTAYWTAEAGSISLSNGCIINTSTASGFNSVFNKSVSIAGKVVKCYFKISSSASTAKIYYYNGSTIAIASILSIQAGKIYEISALVPSDATLTELRINITGAVPGTVETISAFYIGDGTTSQPIIDNISGSCNSTAQSGVVSTTGVSGKACQFLGYKAVQLDLSKYANTQSWWTSRWINIGDLNSSINPRFWSFDAKEYAFKDGGSSSTSSNTIIVSTYNGSQVLSGAVTIPAGAHHVIVQTTITSSTSAIKKVYIDGILEYTFTSTADFTSLTFGNGYIGGSSLTDGVMSGWQDDWCFGTGEITPAQVRNLYNCKGRLPKYYNLNNYNIDNGLITADSCTGNAETATKLATARTIGGVSFDGSANINLPGVNAAGNQDTTGNAATATTAAACTGNAATATSATTASSCSGNANTSTTASNLSAAAGTAIIPCVTSDPSNPVVGQIWLRIDL